METNTSKTKTMEKLHFDIEINADANKVYEVMLDEKGYSEWTAEFNPTSRFKGSWDKGSKIQFIGTSAEGKEEGMVSRIRENIPGKFVSILHEGIIKDGQEITSGEEVETWAGALEEYTFKQTDGITTVSVDVDTDDSFKDYMQETYPRALRKLKEICEK
jgi:hypothetical protein